MLTTGTQAPDLDLPVTTIDGEATTLRTLANGNALLVILLKTSCKSCKIGLPFASELQKRLGDAPLTIVAVSQDSPNVTRSFKRRSEVDLPFVLDPDPFPMSQSYEIEATPSWFLIGTDGEIKQTALGVFHAPLNELLGAIADLLPGAPRLAYADIDPPRMSRATGFTSVVQQLSVSFGVSIGAFVLEWVRFTRGDISILADDFPTAFLVVAGISMMSIVFFLRLPPGAGSEMSGHRRRPQEPSRDPVQLASER